MRITKTALGGYALAIGLLAAPLSVSPASALDAFSNSQQQQFLDWCTGEKKATESTCSCALKSLAQTVPAAALASFLNGQTSGSGFSMSNLAVSATAATATSVTQALATCSR